MSKNMSTLRDLCITMRALQDDKDANDEAGKVITAQLDDIRLRQIPELMQLLEVKTATFENIGRVQLAGDLYCSTVAGKKEEAMQWLRDCGYAEMIAESYNASSMKALIRRMIVDGADIPDFLNVTPFTRASIVKG